jgi:hypothetical protein
MSNAMMKIGGSMEETLWDKYWKKQPEIEIKDIIKNDPFYRLLKQLINASFAQITAKTSKK